MIRSCRGGGGPRSTGRLVARLSTAVTVSPGRSGEVGGDAAAVDVGESAPPVPTPVGVDASASTNAGGPGAGRAGGLGRCPVTAVIVARACSDARPSDVPPAPPRDTVAGTRVDGAGDGGEATRAPGEAEADGAGGVCGNDDGVPAGRLGRAVEGLADGVGTATADGSGSGSVDGRGSGSADGRGTGRETTAVGRGRGTVSCTSTTSATETLMASGEVATSTSGSRDGDGVSAWAGSAPRAAPSATAPSATAPSATAPSATGGRLCLSRIRRRLSAAVSPALPGPAHRSGAAGRAVAPRTLPFPPCAGSCPGRWPATPSVDICTKQCGRTCSAPGRFTPELRSVSAWGQAAGHAVGGSASTGR
ncbi:Period circadian protein [Micromonospora noduli]|nr:Period circadian protein [Micromonospora noduli]